MDITIFDLLLIIKDTEKPFILTDGEIMEKFTYKELALDHEMLYHIVSGIRCDTFNGRPSYIIKIRGEHEKSQ